MPNHIVNHISLQGDPKKIRSMLEAIKSDELGIGSVDFNKIIPMPKSLDIEAGSRTDRGLQAYRDFIDVYTFARSINDTAKALEKIPVESEEVFLRQRTDIRRDEWELGKTAWHNIREYRRCTWTVGGQKKIVWRCISRLDYGKKYCHQSPTMEEASLQDAIMETILKTAKVNPEILQTLKMHIQMGLGCETQADDSIEIQIRIAQIDREFKEMLNSVTVQNQGSLLSDPRIESLITEKRMLENKLAQYSAEKEHRKNITSRLDEIFTVLEGMKNHPLTYDDQIVRQILQCVVVESKQKIKVVFIGGLEVECDVEQA